MVRTTGRTMNIWIANPGEIGGLKVDRCVQDQLTLHCLVTGARTLPRVIDHVVGVGALVARYGLLLGLQTTRPPGGYQ